MSRMRFIDAAKATYPVSRLCRLVGVSRAGCDAWCRRPPSPRARADATLTEAMRAIHATSRQTYGSPRIHAALCAAGTHVSRNRVMRWRRAAGLRGCGARRQVRTTVSDPGATPAPNLVQRQCDVGEFDRVWVTDSTCLATNAGGLYLAARRDACSRRVVGWALADHRRTELALEALDMAVRERCPHDSGFVHHRDRGCQYTAGAYQAALATHAMRCSLSRSGNCLDNAMAESFCATVKRELMPAAGWPTRAAARAAVCEWIAVSYNRRRLHSSLGYRTPLDCETAKAHHQAA